MLAILGVDLVLIVALGSVLVLDVGDGGGGAEAAIAAVQTDRGPTDATVPSTTVPVVSPAPFTPPPADGLTAAERQLSLASTVGGDIAPKSVVHSGEGVFAAQNMMYRHTVTIYDRTGALLATVPDTVDLHSFRLADAPGEWQGSPVEAAFTSDGRYVYVSNYQMYGPGYANPGDDGCADTGTWDESFVYRIDVASATIDQVIPVGAVPKYLAVTPDDSQVLVTNWCSYDLSIIDVDDAVEISRLDIGRFPRGIAVTSDSTTAYITVMGGQDLAVVDLRTQAIAWIRAVGANPRHVLLSPDDRYLYVTLNGESRLAKVDTTTGEVVARVETGLYPRSMDISDDGTALYVVNYKSDSVSKVATDELVELEELPAGDRPIGVTYDADARQVWVANYGGTIQIFDDMAPTG